MFELANVKTNIVCVCVCARASGWVAKEGVCKHFKRGTGGNEGKARCNKCFKIFEKSVTTTLRYHADSLRVSTISSLKQGRIHGNPVADGWAGAVMQKTLGIQKYDQPIYRPTYRPTRV